MSETTAKVSSKMLSRAKAGPVRRILVTGATGYIGRVVVDKLLAMGESVVGYSISRGSNVMDKYELINAMAGCDRVIHLAAMVSFNERDAIRVTQTNILGTRNVLAAALEREIQKVVIVSSAITAGISNSPTFYLNEDCAWPPGTIIDAYTSSKIASEHMSNPNVFPAVIVMPSTANTFLFMKKAAEDKVIVVPPGGTNIISVEDVADGIIAALDHGEVGHRYILSNVNISYKNLFEKIRGGSRKPVIVLPGWSKRTCKFIARFSRDRYTSPFTVDNSFGYKYYTNTKAKNVLGWEPKINLDQIIEKEREAYRVWKTGSRKLIKNSTIS